MVLDHSQFAYKVIVGYPNNNHKTTLKMVEWDHNLMTSIEFKWVVANPKDLELNKYCNWQL